MPNSLRRLLCKLNSHRQSTRVHWLFHPLPPAPSVPPPPKAPPSPWPLLSCRPGHPPPAPPPILYQDPIRHNEMFSSIYKIQEIADGLCLETEGKMVSRTEGDIDDSLLGGNASAEGPEGKGTQSPVITGVDVVRKPSPAGNQLHEGSREEKHQR